MDIHADVTRVFEYPGKADEEGNYPSKPRVGELPNHTSGAGKAVIASTWDARANYVWRYCNDFVGQNHALVRLEEVARLASSVGHEIANSLTVIMLTCSWISDSLSEDDPRLSDIKNLSEETVRIRLLLRGLIDFIKPTQRSTEVTDVSPVLKKLVRDLSAGGAEANVRWRFLLPGALLVRCSIGQLDSVFRGVILASLLTFRRGLISVCGFAGQDYHTVEVSGRFDGDRAEIEKMLDLVHSVKAYGDVGLAFINSRKMVQDLGGRFVVDNSCPKQVIFRLALPAATA